MKKCNFLILLAPLLLQASGALKEKEDCLVSPVQELPQPFTPTLFDNEGVQLQSFGQMSGQSEQQPQNQPSVVINADAPWIYE